MMICIAPCCSPIHNWYLAAKLKLKILMAPKKLLKISKGCPVGEKIIIAGKGFPKLRGSGRGNLVVITNCDIPKKLSEKAKEHLVEYSREIGTTTQGNSGISGFFKKFLG